MSVSMRLCSTDHETKSRASLVPIWSVRRLYLNIKVFPVDQRTTIAYILMAVMAAGISAAIWYARHNTARRRDSRSRKADIARYDAKMKE